MNNGKNDNLDPRLRNRKFEMILVFKVSGKFQVTVCEPNSENLLDLNFDASFLRNVSLYQIQIILYLQSENSC